MSSTRSENTNASTSTAAEPAVILPARLQREYEVVAKLGQGGMGAVYQARHQRLKRFVAINVLPAEKTPPPWLGFSVRRMNSPTCHSRPTHASRVRHRMKVSP